MLLLFDTDTVAAIAPDNADDGGGDDATAAATVDNDSHNDDDTNIHIDTAASSCANGDDATTIAIAVAFLYWYSCCYCY
jgi:hypothetical protein